MRNLKETAQRRWLDLTDNHPLAVTIGFVVSFLLVVAFFHYLDGKTGAVSPSPNSLLFRAILEEGNQTKNLILRGRIIGSRGEVCFMREGERKSSDCPILFPVLAWSHGAVRAEVNPSASGAGTVWLVTGEGVKSNELEISF